MYKYTYKSCLFIVNFLIKYVLLIIHNYKDYIYKQLLNYNLKKKLKHANYAKEKNIHQYQKLM